LPVHSEAKRKKLMHLFLAKPLPVLQMDGKTMMSPRATSLTTQSDSVANAEYEPAAMYTQTPAGTLKTPQFSDVPPTFQPDVPDAYAAVRDIYGRRDESLSETGFGHQQSQTAEFGGARMGSDSPSTSLFGGVRDDMQTDIQQRTAQLPAASGPAPTAVRQRARHVARVAKVPSRPLCPSCTIAQITTTAAAATAITGVATTVFSRRVRFAPLRNMRMSTHLRDCNLKPVHWQPYRETSAR
jgi:hypothetical protein